MRKHPIAMLTATAVAAAALLTGCADQDDQECRTQFIYFVNGSYHYGSPTGKLVPHNKLPKDATKVPGYKAPKADAPKQDGPKPPKDAPKNPAPATKPKTG